MLQRCLLLSVLSISSLVAAQPPPEPNQPRHGNLVVESVKPSLIDRAELNVAGTVLEEATGGWTSVATSKWTETTPGEAKIVLTVDATAPASATTKGAKVPFKAKASVAELKGKSKGSYALEVVNATGTVVWVGRWENGSVVDATCPPGEDVRDRGTRSQRCAAREGKCAAGRKAITTPITPAGELTCVPDKP